jgi:hypothetical protein
MIFSQHQHGDNFAAPSAAEKAEVARGFGGNPSDGDGEPQHRAGRPADAEQTLKKAEDLGRRYTGQGGTPRLDPRWLIPGRLRLGLVWKDMGKTSDAREVLQKA